ncbi:putative minor capsid protein [Eel River basin pequenovirus]|nr:putative minor capsid protein [Eel River basin pequenovirus]
MSQAFAELVRDSEIPKDQHRKFAREFTKVEFPEGSGKTKQEFKEECDINFILERASRTGMVSHLSKFEPQYADISGVDLQEMMDTVAHANTMFAELPAEVRREFGNNQQAFFDFVNDPSNQGKLAEKLPALAKRGNQLPNVDRRTAPIETSARTSSTPAKPVSGSAEPQAELSGDA